MNFEESLNYINNTAKFGTKLGLESINNLLNKLGNPQENFKIIHIAGTNGKGSTASFLSHILVEGGSKTGLYTSPGLINFNERIKINNKDIDDESIAWATTKVKKAADELISEGFQSPTEFEIVTAVGFLCFEKENVDIVVLEVGMGGRYDATNIIKNPLASVIVSISKDHTDYLGDTLKEIAHEKGGIIKENSNLILYPQDKEAEDEIKRIGKEKNSKIYNVDLKNKTLKSSTLDGQVFDAEVLGTYYEDLKIRILGDHQINNSITALTCIEMLKQNKKINISEDAIRKGLYNTTWQGRFEILKTKPLTIIDGAHNVGGAKVFEKTVEDLLEGYDLTLIIGMLRDKDYNGVLDLILNDQVKSVITLKPDNPRAMEAEDLAEIIKSRGFNASPSESVEDSYKRALEITDDKKGCIIYLGSLYMIGNVKKFIESI